MSSPCLRAKGPAYAHEGASQIPIPSGSCLRGFKQVVSVCSNSARRALFFEESNFVSDPN